MAEFFFKKVRYVIKSRKRRLMVANVKCLPTMFYPQTFCLYITKNSKAITLTHGITSKEGNNNISFFGELRKHTSCLNKW